MFLILDIHLDLVLIFSVRNGKGGMNGKFETVLAARAQKGPDDSVCRAWRNRRRRSIATSSMIEDREDCLDRKMSTKIVGEREGRTEGWMVMLSGAVVGCTPIDAGARGRAR